MDYVYSPDASAAIEYLTRTLKEHLGHGERVLWLLSGGSGAKVCLAAAAQLGGTPLENLYVTLSDERYGHKGHPDENWQQLLDGGFDLPGAHLYRPLEDKGRASTTLDFAKWLQEQIKAADYSVGLFGIGPDGHTAGIKPGSPAVSSTEWAADFTGEDFERITMTFPAIEALDEAVVQAMGEDKAPTIDLLLHDIVDLANQPAQVLKRVKKSTLYTDYKEV